MRRRAAAFSLALLLMLIGALWLLYRPDLALHVATSAISQTFCDEVFISGLDPQRVFSEEIEPDPGFRILLKRIHYTIDRTHRRVLTNWAGRFASTATLDGRYGCTLGEPLAATTNIDLPAASVETLPVVSPATPSLAAALDRAFAEPNHPPYRRVRAVVVMRNGGIIAERYASGIYRDTPLLAYSVSKSVINALIGILVKDGKLNLYTPAPVAAWRSSSDPRHVITLDQLLRMSSGLKLDERDTGFDPVSRMLFTQPDMATYAEGAALKQAPGTRWEYTSGNTLIASSILRDAVGGSRNDVQNFAQHRLFDPLGMRHVILEFDKVGTPIGSTRILAPARDWARFGNLYIDDNLHLLPPDWVAYATKPTLGSDYGSGFWLHLSAPSKSIPADAFFASGKFGQRIVIIPSHRLVIVRFGVTIDPPSFDIKGLRQLVVDVLEAENSTQ
jgi:hypothetical protein